MAGFPSRVLEPRLSGPETQAHLAGCGSEAASSLLVSVRNLEEATIAADSGVNLVDFKEPARGALAPTDPELWRQAAEWKKNRSGVALSAALGEPAEAMALAHLLPGAFDFAKPGTSGCGREPQLHKLWQGVRCKLAPEINLVAVAYADDQAAASLPAEIVFREAANAGLRHCLVDTYQKDGRSTLDHLSRERLVKLSELARQLGLWWALAGSLKASDARELLHAGICPDCFGVRGDVCASGRESGLKKERIVDWQAAMRAGVRGSCVTPS